jgi:hypothetical protein
VSTSYNIQHAERIVRTSRPIGKSSRKTRLFKVVLNKPRIDIIRVGVIAQDDVGGKLLLSFAARSLEEFFL